MFSAFVTLALVATNVYGTQHLDRNLAYRSPFSNDPQASHNTKNIQARHIQHARRQTVDAGSFTDEHYPTFYGGDFSNSPFVRNGGINFTHSGLQCTGDPFDTSVLLWTRALPISEGPTPDESVPVCVAFKISRSPTLSGRIIDSGEAFTTFDVDFTVKVEATGLEPDTKYFFQFSDCTNPKTASPIGTTRTLPSPNTPAHLVNGGKSLTLAVFSCSRYQNGFFNAYGVAAHNTTADLFIHLGDYVRGPSVVDHPSLPQSRFAAIGRMVLGRETATIHDYRLRLNQYRTDVSLVDAHVAGPWITDDHEVSDQAWKAGTADSNDTAIGCSFSPSGACFTDRKLAAVRAYHEWMPIRQVDPNNQLRIWRNFQIGKLVDLTMLDTRQYNRDITDLYYNTVINSLADEKNRSLMGADQEQWLFKTLTESKKRGAIWRIIGQQIVFTQLNFGGFFNVDSWDGYRANRNRILDHLVGGHIDNAVILSGDSHGNWVSDLAHPNDTTRYNPITGAGAVGVEFAGTAVTSTSTFGADTNQSTAEGLSRQLVQANPDLQWSEGFFRGFYTLTVDVHQIKADFFAMRNITIPNLEAFVSASFVVENGANKLKRPVAGGKINAGALKSSVAPREE
ncbi:hypothetical protein BDN71DRAFT_1380970 [Pleurotus eryngii]|uniref:Alkaline phosphatase n=1 Tax=Pleurotus eryngii TaxID=5323 RepID=A0A9P6DJH5_PLEER|nr:hypothetical protein BDN71DRAFT_1380970 [Pleurotus eryngii]